MLSIINKLLSLPYSIYFNLRYLPFKQALKLPILIGNNVKVHVGGRHCFVIEGEVRPKMIQLGVSNGSFNMAAGHQSYLNISKNARFVYMGGVNIARGFKIMVSGNGVLKMGNNVHLNAFSMLSSNSLVELQEGVRSGWECTIIDWDGHNIVSVDSGLVINQPKPIVLKRHSWLGSKSSILKGVTLAEFSIVPYGSIITKSNDVPVAVFGGQPNRVLKQGIARIDKHKLLNGNADK